MSRAVHPSLTPALVARFAQTDLTRHLGSVLPLVTVDRDGREKEVEITIGAYKEREPSR
jgi:hypothetical protein